MSFRSWARDLQTKCVFNGHELFYQVVRREDFDVSCSKIRFSIFKIESNCVVNARANNSFLQPQSEIPDVCLTSLDSLRLDSLVPFFYNRQQTPNYRFAIF